MSVNYENGTEAELPDGWNDRAKKMGFQVIHVVCFAEPDSVDGAIDFYTTAPFIPRMNDTIVLENDRVCRVADTMFRMARFVEPDQDMTILVPCVTAHLIKESDTE